MREAARRITAFHEKQRQNTWLNFEPAISLGQKITPVSYTHLMRETSSFCS